MKTGVSFQSSKQENMHIIVKMSNSHKRSLLSFAPKRVVFQSKVIFEG